MVRAWRQQLTDWRRLFALGLLLFLPLLLFLGGHAATALASSSRRRAPTVVVATADVHVVVDAALLPILLRQSKCQHITSIDNRHTLSLTQQSLSLSLCLSHSRSRSLLTLSASRVHFISSNVCGYGNGKRQRRGAGANNRTSICRDESERESERTY